MCAVLVCVLPAWILTSHEDVIIVLLQHVMLSVTLLQNIDIMTFWFSTGAYVYILSVKKSYQSIEVRRCTRSH